MYMLLPSFCYKYEYPYGSGEDIVDNICSVLLKSFGYVNLPQLEVVLESGAA